LPALGTVLVADEVKGRVTRCNHWFSFSEKN